MRVIYLSDIHFPYQSNEAWGMTVDLVGRMKPDRIFLGGDIYDFYQVSHFQKDPARRFGLQDDLDVGFKELQRLRKAAPHAEMIFKEGNHELRLQAYLFSQAAELSGLRGLSLPELLRFKDLGITRFVRNAERYKIGHLYYLHGNETRTGGVHPARSMYQKVGVNVIFGHVHKFDRHGDHAINDRTHEAYANGCLCLLTPDYLFNPQWDNGFSVIDYVESGLFNVDQIKFFRHQGSTKVIYNGKLLTGSRRGKVIQLPRSANADALGAA